MIVPGEQKPIDVEINPNLDCGIANEDFELLQLFLLPFAVKAIYSFDVPSQLLIEPIENALDLVDTIQNNRDSVVVPVLPPSTER
jgi:hypothetical protein